jgi:Peptidase family M28
MLQPVSRIRLLASSLPRSAVLLSLVCAALVSACARPTPFSEQNARAHINQLAGTIGSRPVASDQNRRAREYLIDQLRFFGYTVRVQETDAERRELGLTAHVQNIIAIVPGARPEALGLVAHYDSRATSPGAGDDGLGVAVALECARLLAARRDRRHSLMVLLTDAEEDGLMGAAAIVRDPEVRSRLRAYINLDAIGTDGPAPLFETGPGNAWIVQTWARAAQAPRGGSYQLEVYRRLPSDTDFSVLKGLEVPGLNFAAVGNGYVYHTPRDTPDRVTSRAILDMGASALETAEALDATDLSARSPAQAVYFDLSGIRAIVLGSTAGRALSVLAIVLATVALVRTSRVALLAGGVAGVVRTYAWAAVGVLLTGGALVGMTALLREWREVYHPWYAHPARFWTLLLLTALVVIEILLRAGERLPAVLRAVRHPAAVWMVTLPVWMALVIGAEALAPFAAYLWSVPLAALAATAALAPAASRAGARLGAVVVLAVSGALWLPEGREVLRFGIPLFGRLSVVTPVAVYPAALLMILVMVAPAFLALDVAGPPPVPDDRLSLWARRLRRLLTPALLLALSLAFAACYLAEAYTFDRPLQRVVQYVADHSTGRAAWEVAGVEPGLDLDLARGAPAGWTAAQGPPPTGLARASLPYPFVFRAPGRLEPPPVEAILQSAPAVGDLQIEIAATTREPGVTVLFVLPRDLAPRRSSLPGTTRGAHWIAAYAGAPVGVVRFAATLRGTVEGRLGEIRVGAISRGLPGGQGWLRQPAWLGSLRTVWHSRSFHVVTPGSVTPPAPLR